MSKNTVFCILYPFVDVWCCTLPWQMGGRLQWHPASPRQTWASQSPLPLGLVAWEAYSDWVISPSPVAGVLLYSPCISTNFLAFWVHIFHWLPSCYNIERSCPVFDRIELTLYRKWIQQLLYSWYMQNAVVLLYPVVYTSSTTSPKH